MKRAFLAIALLAGCSGPASPPPLVDAAVGPDLALPPYPRTLVTRPLWPTSPQNLLRDPLLGGDGAPDFGQFRAYYVNGPSIRLRRTFRSVSPVGGAVSIEELRDLPAPPQGATAIRVTASFLGGPGSFHATIWISAGDASAAPIPFATAAPSIVPALLGNDGKTKVMLAPKRAPASFGGREWVQLETQGDVALPSGGWLSIELTDFSKTLQLAAPEVTSTALGGPAPPPRPPGSRAATMTDRDRDALRQARRPDLDRPKPRPREPDDR